MNLLTKSNAKTIKSLARGVLTYILYLAPGRVSGFQVCPMASPGCLEACLFSAGRGKMSNVRNARIRKTRLFFEDRDTFMQNLVADVAKAVRLAEKKGIDLAIRLNGTSDIRWETVPVDATVSYRNKETRYVARNIFEAFPDVQFYDYTKIPNRRNIPENYHLTFSRSETNDKYIPKAREHGMNVAVVFSGDLPDKYMNLPVINGDETDMRFTDPDGVVVGLKAKGDAKNDDSGFVVSPD